MGRLGIPELLIILGIVILIFGANRLPELGKGIGKAIRNFKDATNEGEATGHDGLLESNDLRTGVTTLGELYDRGGKDRTGGLGGRDCREGDGHAKNGTREDEGLANRC